MAFVDTSFWFARTVGRDRWHPVAIELSSRLSDSRIVTSNLVLGETWTLLAHRAGHRHALRWLESVRQRSVDVERIDAALEDEAWAWLRLHDERPYSFVDATSFALMRKLRIDEALAFDGDFAAAGFTELRP